MKFRNRFLKYKLHSIGEGGDAGGGGGGDAGGDAGAGGDGGGNNDDGNLLSHDTMWDDPDTGGGSPDANAGGQQQQQQQQAPSANEQFDTHIAGLDFMGGVDVQATMAALQSGDVEAFGKALHQVGANAYRNSMIDGNRVINQRVDAMGTQVKTDVNASNATSRVVSEMNAALPFTTAKAYAPMAKVVLTQFMGRGKTAEQAIEEVGKYFKNLSGEVAKLNPEAPNARPSGAFGGGNGFQSDGNNGEEPDWLDILGGAPAQ